MLGYVMCPCGAPVLNEVAWKTGGSCGECFRAKANEFIDAHMVIVAGRERLVLRTVRSKRSPADIRQRRRAKKRSKQTTAAKRRAKLVSSARQAADRRLRSLFPEIWEIILADERSKAGLDDFTIDRCLQGNPLSSSLDDLAKYSHTEVPA